MKLLYFLVFVVSFVGTAQAQTKKLTVKTTPCAYDLKKDARPPKKDRRRVFKIDNVRWLLDRTKKCGQMGEDSVRTLAKIKLEYVGLKKDNADLKQQSQKNKEALNHWNNVRLPNLQQQIATYKSSADLSSKQAAMWKSKYEDLRAKKKPWHEHPAFVITASVTATLAVVAVAGYAVSQFQRPQSTTTSSLRLHSGRIQVPVKVLPLRQVNQIRVVLKRVR